MNFRQHQVKETTNKLQPYMFNQALLTFQHCINRPSNILIKCRTKVSSNRKGNTFYGNYYSKGISSIKLGIPQ